MDSFDCLKEVCTFFSTIRHGMVWILISPHHILMPFTRKTCSKGSKQVTPNNNFKKLSGDETGRV